MLDHAKEKHRMKKKPYKRIVTVFFALMVLFCFVSGKEAHAYSQHEREKTVRVGWYQSDMFQEGTADDQIKKGYCYDYLQKVSGYTNWKYEYVRVGGREIL